MCKPLPLLLLLFLSLSFSGRISGQAPVARDQQLTKLKNPENPPGSAPLVLSTSTERSSEAKRLYEEGMKLVESGQFQLAVETFQQAIKLDATYADAYAALGRTYFKMRQWQPAIDNLRRASELNAKEREAQDALHKKLALQKQENSVKAATNVAADSKPPTDSTTKSNEPPKTLRTEPSATRQPEPARNPNSTLKSTPLVAENKKPATNTTAPLAKPSDPPTTIT